MNSETGREFSFTNPQDDPDLYPTPPPGYHYDLEGMLKQTPMDFLCGPDYYEVTQKRKEVRDTEIIIKDIRKENSLLDDEGFLEYIAITLGIKAIITVNNS